MGRRRRDYNLLFFQNHYFELFALFFPGRVSILAHRFVFILDFGEDLL